MESDAIAVDAVGMLGFGLISRRVQSSVITPPMVFVALGFLVSARGLHHLGGQLSEGLIHTLTSPQARPDEARCWPPARRSSSR